MKKIATQFRQGDVLIEAVDRLPEKAMPLPATARVVLAEGEATGHAHAIKAERGAVRPHHFEGELYLEVRSPVTVTHEEHGEIPLEPGTYRVRRQVEQWMDEVHRVAD